MGSEKGYGNRGVGVGCGEKSFNKFIFCHVRQVTLVCHFTRMCLHKSPYRLHLKLFYNVTKPLFTFILDTTHREYYFKNRL